jgi:hypothetical protein
MKANRVVHYIAVFFCGCVVTLLTLKTFSPLPKITNTHTTTIDTIVTEMLVPGKIVVKYLPHPEAEDVVAASPEYSEQGLCDSMRFYSIVHEDSIVKVTGYDTVVGKSISMSLLVEIKPRIDTTITITIIDSIITTIEVPIPQRAMYVKGGLGMDKAGLKALNIGVDMLTKKKWGVGYHYSIPIGNNLLTKTHNLDFKYKLFAN